MAELRERGSQATLGQRAWVNAVREVAELGAGPPELVFDLAKLRRDGRARLVACLGERGGHIRKPLFGAVAELALEEAALLVRGLDEAPARSGELDDSRANLGLQAGIRDREASCGRDRLDGPGVVERRGVVHEHAYRLAGVSDTGHRSFPSRLRQARGRGRRH